MFYPLVIVIIVMVGASPALAACIEGTSGADLLVGTNRPDCIKGLGGDDDLRGRDGADILDGGGGQDRFTGGAGADQFKVDPGKITPDPRTTRVDRIRDYRKSQGDFVQIPGTPKSYQLSNLFRINGLDSNDRVVVWQNTAGQQGIFVLLDVGAIGKSAVVLK